MQGSIDEIPGNLFDYEKDYALAHCISADFALGAGIAKFFQARYSTRDELRQGFPHVWNGTGYCIITNNNHVINLVTKNNYFDKPTLRNVEAALAHMKEICEDRGIYKIAMPRIGCGLDRLNWQDVKPIITDLFAATAFDIKVIYLHEYLKGNIQDGELDKYMFEHRDRSAGALSKQYF